MSRRIDNDAINTKTTIVIGVSRSTSNGAGFANPRLLAKMFLAPSTIATAICPPSNGKSGNKLNIPTNKFNEAIIKIKVAIFSLTVKALVFAVSPLTRATPTTPTNPSGSRFSPPKVWLIKLGILVGSEINDVALFCRISPVNLPALATESTGP